MHSDKISCELRMLLHKVRASEEDWPASASIQESFEELRRGRKHQRRVIAVKRKRRFKSFSQRAVKIWWHEITAQSSVGPDNDIKQ